MTSFKAIGLLLTLFFFAVITPFSTPAEAKPEYLIKMASLAPEGSSWVKAVREIDAQLQRQTDGKVGIKLYPGGVQGDDDVVLRKMRIGQLHAAGFAGQGVTNIFPDILVLEMPFFFANYDEVDYVLGQMDGYFRQGLEEKGFILLGWADIGFVHILSKHPIRGVADIEKRKVWRLENEPITKVLFRKAGVTSVPLNIPDVLLGLQTNLIDVVYAPPAAAIVMQWFTRVKYITQLPINYTLGAMLIDKREFGRLEPEHRKLLLDTSREQMRQLSLQTRKENEEALKVMLDNGLQEVVPNPDDVATFQQLVEASIPELVGKALSREAYDLARLHLQNYRKEHPATQ